MTKKLTDAELQELFRKAGTLNESYMWKTMAVAYLGNGYPLNAKYCMDKSKEADEKNTSQSAKTPHH